MKIQTAYERLLIVLFLAALVAPVVGTVLGWGPDPAAIRLAEKRAPASPPRLAWSREAVAALPGSVDTYWNDFFGFRQNLVALQGRVKLFLRASVATPSHRREVLIGNGGWLFLANEQQVLRQVRGVDTLTPSDLARWVDMVRTWRDWARERGIPFVCAVPPNKHTVYPEHLPAWVRRNRTGMSELDQLAHELAGEPSFLDLRSALFAAKAVEPYRIYSRLDSHWDGLGAFFAYQAIMDRLFAGSPPVAVVTRNELRVAVGPREGADLVKILGLQASLVEDHVWVRAPERNADAAAVVEPAHHRPVRLLVVGDSYSGGLRQFFDATFDDTQYVNFAHSDQVAEAFRTRTPDVLLIEVVERILNDPAIADRLRRLVPAAPAGGEHTAAAVAAVGHTG